MNSYEKLARILKTSPEALQDLDQKMSKITGQNGVIETIASQNEILVTKTLHELGLNRSAPAETVYTSLIHRLIHLDQMLYELLDSPDLSKMSQACGKLCETALKLYNPPKGLFIKKEKITELLDKFPPDNMLTYFGYANTKELIDKEGLISVVSALRFTQDQEWMHKFFDTAYRELKPEDFEERNVELKVLETKWLNVVDKFIEKKYHNISHLKEFGIIFVIPLPIDTPGETIRMFTLIMHYLHEVPFYSDLFRKFIKDPDFITKFKSLLRGDVIEDEKLKIKNEKLTWLVIQRYLAKDDENDPRLFLPHINPEAEHWLKVSEDLNRLDRMMDDSENKVGLGYWASLDFVGDFFKDERGHDQLVSFDLIDLIMSLVKKGQIKYLYHQQEAIWNRIFSEYMGHEKMNQLIEENMIKGLIEL